MDMCSVDRKYGFSRSHVLQRRVEALRERAVRSTGAKQTFGVEGVIFDDGLDRERRLKPARSVEQSKD